jgi:hypothetical protein
MACRCAASEPQPSQFYTAIRGKKVIHASDGERVDLTDVWGRDERAVVAFARSLA